MSSQEVFRQGRSHPLPLLEGMAVQRMGGRSMENEMLKAKEEINRALGWLEGISYGVEPNIATGIIDAVETIDNALRVVFGND